MKKLWSAVLALLISALSCTNLVFAAQNGPDVFAESYCVMNLDTGEVVFSKNMNEELYPASITKIMTALVTLEHAGDLEDTVEFSDYAVNSLTSNSSTLSPKAKVGEQMSLENTLYGMMLSSANECANALAEYTAGSADSFAEMMNEKAKALGCENTHFVNAHGLHDEKHYTSAYDMAVIFQAAMRNPVFSQIVSTVNYTIPQTNLTESRECTNTNALVNQSVSFEGAYAGKTGHTAEAGRTLVTAARRYNVNLVCVIMKSNNEHYYTDTEILLEYAFGMLSGSYPDVQYTAKDDWVVVAPESLRMREFASTYAAVKGSLANQDRVHRTGTYAGWSKVEDSGTEYWVSTDFLVNDNGETVAAPYETAAPTDGVPVETTAAPTTAAPTTEAVKEPQTEASTAIPTVNQEMTNASQAATTEAVSHGWEINSDILRYVIFGLIALIALLLGILTAVLIIRR